MNPDESDELDDYKPGIISMPGSEQAKLLRVFLDRIGKLDRGKLELLAISMQDGDYETAQKLFFNGFA